MIVALTGASGYIGHSLLNRLLQSNATVVSLSRRNSPTASLGSVPGADSRAVQYDLENPRPNPLGATEHVDVLAHLAAYVPKSRRPEDDDAAKCTRTNVLGTYNVLHHVGSLARRIVYISTLEVYGIPTSSPVAESHPTNPVTYYGASKLAGENYSLIFSKKYGKKCTILRLSTVYGPDETYDRAIPNFIDSAMRGTDLKVYGDGSDVRDYVYFEDVVNAIILAITRDVEGIYNIASGIGHSIREVAQKVVDISGGNSRISFMPPVHKPTTLVLDIAKSKQSLGYSPQVSLDEGLRRVFNLLGKGTTM